MTRILYGLFALYLAITAIFIVTENRRPQATFAWMLLFISFPGVGVWRSPSVGVWIGAVPAVLVAASISWNAVLLDFFRVRLRTERERLAVTAIEE